MDWSYCAEALGFRDGSGGGGAGDARDFVCDLQELMLSHPSQFRRECASIVRQLQGLPPHRTRLRRARFQMRELAILESGRVEGLRAAYPVEEAEAPMESGDPGGMADPINGKETQRNLPSSTSMPKLLRHLIKNLPKGCDPEERSRREDYIIRKKWPQIQWMSAEVDKILHRIR